jgi:predicted negative regulator of RcsB-dependent stress response
MKIKYQNGFAHMALILLVVVLAVAAFAGYKVMQSNDTTADNSAPAVHQTETIKTTSDLDSAKSTLDSSNVDNDLNPDSMNQDVDSLL